MNFKRFFKLPPGLLLYRFLSYPYPYRTALIRLLSQQFPNLLYRPHYYNLMYEAAKLASFLGHEKISCLEFGVAGGNGMLALQKYSQKVARAFGINIEIYGFDTGIGLPPSEDYRDLPYFWRGGDFKMDYENLKKKLHKSTLVLGDVKDTIKTFFEKYEPAPIGAIIFDLDYYSSTCRAFEIFNHDLSHYLPRVVCYFDNVGCHGVNEFTGEALAIKEFNEKNAMRKIVKDFGTLKNTRHGCHFEEIFYFHAFEHPDYST